MTRRIEVRIPRLPAVAPAAASDGGGTGAFGPLAWQWSSISGVDDYPESISKEIYSYVFASCPGAASYRLEYEEFGTPFPLPPLVFDALTGGVIIYLDQYLRAFVYAVSATGAELGPIDVYITGE